MKCVQVWCFGPGLDWPSSVKNMNPAETLWKKGKMLFVMVQMWPCHRNIHVDPQTCSGCNTVCWPSCLPSGGWFEACNGGGDTYSSVSRRPGLNTEQLTPKTAGEVTPRQVFDAWFHWSAADGWSAGEDTHAHKQTNRWSFPTENIWAFSRPNVLNSTNLSFVWLTFPEVSQTHLIPGETAVKLSVTDPRLWERLLDSSSYTQNWQLQKGGQN